MLDLWLNININQKTNKMKLEKKHWIMLIAGAVVLYLVYRFFFKKQAESSYDPYLPIFGGGMLENNNYTASQLDPMGIESGYSAAMLDPMGIESNYKKSCPCGKGGIISSPQCCKGATTSLRAAGSTSGPQQIGNCGTGWKPCVYCTGGIDNQGNCGGWTTYCCKGSQVAYMPKLGFESGYYKNQLTGGLPNFESGYRMGGGKCVRCKDGCNPPCDGNCAEVVDCPKFVPASPL
jgi:hypothetical protein